MVWHVAVDMNNFGICEEKEKLWVLGAKVRLETGPGREREPSRSARSAVLQRGVCRSVGGVRTLAGGRTAVVRTDFLSPGGHRGRMTRRRFAFRCPLVRGAV